MYHLLACVAANGRFSGKSILICKDSIWEFNAVNDCLIVLTGLLELYWKGISGPLPFFPETSFRFAEQRLQKNKSEQAALAAARKKWVADEFSWGESQDPYNELIFSRYDPFGNYFNETAEFVFAPIFKYASSIKTN